MLTTIRILKPSFVVGENVAGLVSMDNGKTLERILSDLENEGYQTESFIIPACSIGAWHRRDRIWIVCYRGQTYSNPRCSERGRDNKSQERQQYTSGWESFGKSDALYNTLCYTNCNGCKDGHQKTGGDEQQSKQGRMCESEGASNKSDIPDANNRRCEKQRLNKSIQSDIEREAEGIESEYSGGCNGREREARTGQLKSELGRMVNGIPLELDGYWNREPDGIPRVATGVKNRVDRLKGLGNAIVPQVAYQIFKAIESVDNFVENNTYR